MPSHQIGSILFIINGRCFYLIMLKIIYLFILIFSLALSTILIGCTKSKSSQNQDTQIREAEKEKIMSDFENFNTKVVKVKEGMTEKEVLELLGEPHRKKEDISIWIYDYQGEGEELVRPGYGAEIEFNKGIVAEIGKVWTAEGIDSSDFDNKIVKVKEGMTEKEALELFGKPHKKKEGLNIWIYDYWEKGKQIPRPGTQLFYSATIEFDKGIVKEIDKGWVDVEGR